MTDIHDLDQYTGRYVTLTDPDGESAAGYLVRVLDDVDYIPYPVRHVVLDWGQGWRVSEDTEVLVAKQSPDGQQIPDFSSPLDVLHRAAHPAGACPDFNCDVRARRQLRALRVWRMKQEDAYWQHKYVRRVRELRDDLEQVARVIAEADREGAPPRILDHLEIVATRAQKAAGGS